VVMAWSQDSMIWRSGCGVMRDSSLMGGTRINITGCRVCIATRFCGWQALGLKWRI